MEVGTKGIVIVEMVVRGRPHALVSPNARLCRSAAGLFGAGIGADYGKCPRSTAGLADRPGARAESAEAQRQAPESPARTRSSSSYCGQEWAEEWERQ